MTRVPFSLSLWGAATAGLLSHNLFFIEGEHHMLAPLLLLLSILTISVIFFAESQYGGPQAAWNTAIIVGSYLVSLFASMAIYRTIFHPLHTVPGPFMARVSKLWHLSKVLRSKNHLLLDAMHERYGAFVWTGPSEITVFEPEIFNVMSGPGTTCIKSPWYDMLHPLIGSNSIR